jgi:predicted MFS family arabinose efflux permease
MMSYLDRLKGMPRELKLFFAASLVMGLAYSVMDSTFNNFLSQTFNPNGLDRSFLEFPREIPGFLCLFVSALFWFLDSRRLGAFSLALGAAGAILIGFVSSTFMIMAVWLFIYSMGQHVFMPIASTIGMELAEEGKTGLRLGQLNAVRNLAAIFGSFIVFLGFKSLGFTFQTTFIIIAVGLGIAALLLFSMKPTQPKPAGTFLRLHREYTLFYILSVLYGSRKQLFITFAPWVLVRVFNQPTEIIAGLVMTGGIIGILFQPLLGWMVDHLGERIVLASEAVLLVVVCMGYGFSKFLFPETVAFYIVCACYLLDQMLMSVSMARSTYIKKIAKTNDDIQPALSAGISIDHIFSISGALLGGVIWDQFGFQYVFLFGALIALTNLFFALQVRIPGAKLKPAVALK